MTSLNRSGKLNPVGKQGKVNAAANKKLKQIYFDAGITSCEMCSSTFGLSWHHRHKRVWYKAPGRQHLLSHMSQTILVCIACHEVLEVDAEITSQKFMELRGEEE